MGIEFIFRDILQLSPKLLANSVAIDTTTLFSLFNQLKIITFSDNISTDVNRVVCFTTGWKWRCRAASISAAKNIVNNYNALTLYRTYFSPLKIQLARPLPLMVHKSVSIFSWKHEYWTTAYPGPVDGIWIHFPPVNSKYRRGHDLYFQTYATKGGMKWRKFYLFEISFLSVSLWQLPGHC